MTLYSKYDSSVLLHFVASPDPFFQKFIYMGKDFFTHPAHGGYKRMSSFIASLPTLAIFHIYVSGLFCYG